MIIIHNRCVHNYIVAFGDYSDASDASDESVASDDSDESDEGDASGAVAGKMVLKKFRSGD